MIDSCIANGTISSLPPRFSGRGTAALPLLLACLPGQPLPEATFSHRRITGEEARSPRFRFRAPFPWEKTRCLVKVGQLSFPAETSRDEFNNRYNCSPHRSIDGIRLN